MDLKQYIDYLDLDGDRWEDPEDKKRAQNLRELISSDPELFNTHEILESKLSKFLEPPILFGFTWDHNDIELLRAILNKLKELKNE